MAGLTARAVTVVLSGGGAKTAAHLGAVGALEELGFSPARYVATSMGAVIAAGLAAGVAAPALLERLTEVGRQGSCAIRWRRCSGCSPGHSSGRLRSAERSRRWSQPGGSTSSALR